MKSNSIIEYSVPEYSANMVYGIMGDKSNTPILPKSQKNYISTLMNEFLELRKKETPLAKCLRLIYENSFYGLRDNRPHSLNSIIDYMKTIEHA